MSTWIGRTFISDTGWDHLEALVDIGDRMAGSTGERAAAEVTRDALAEAGARDARLDEFDIQGWERGSSAIEADTETFSLQHECIALPRSPSETATGDLLDLGYGLPGDFEAADCEGKVVMVRSDIPDHYDRYLHRREKYYHAVEAGAAAFVYRNHVEGCLPPTGSVGTQADPIGEVPAVGVSAETGAQLARKYDGEEVSVSVEATIEDATSQNVHAKLGPDTDEEVLVTSHVDAHDISTGAMDNGAGTAMVVELARLLADREDELDTRVRFVCFGAEEVGLVGSEYEADRADFADIKAILNNDGVVQARDLGFYTHGFPELEEALDTVGDRLDHPLKAVPKQGPHSDHWPFTQWGVPGYHAYGETSGTGRGWGHTHADTLDKLEKRDLREQAILLGDLAVHLASDEFEVAHRDPEDIAADLEAEDLAEGMRITGDWPYDEQE
ncbi:M28 family peptidase [Haloarchaeobius sp. HME9146]|uniref:M28 family peptidase n=1 Tax=Haloarchaeobius sp. HME9146 TaxID=2978732 RepID=UPI0021BF6BD2|nr:M28 family peptidase [Haloarchaeobius sp. HME9146]MCT9096162.1 M28 family peptidase [Haloarchaeobius sp. HME9146]